MINNTWEIQLPNPVSQGTTEFTLQVPPSALAPIVAIRGNNIFMDGFYQGEGIPATTKRYQYAPVNHQWDDDDGQLHFTTFVCFVPVPSATYVLLLKSTG